MLSLERYVVGPLKTNCYLINDVETNTSALIDPGGISCELERKLKNINLKYILLTHGHFDHIRKALHYKELTNAKIVICELEKDFLKDNSLNLSEDFSRDPISAFSADILLHDGDILELGSSNIKTILTPGHTRGSCCYVTSEYIFSGDTLMNGCIGRTDLATGSPKDMRESLKKLHNIIDEHLICPGHGEMFRK